MRTFLHLTTLAVFTTTALAGDEVIDLDAFSVSVGPAARSIDDFANPISVLSESDIEQSNAGTLGELLEDLPGLSASSFGGGASRPIIRGFYGPRVRIVESGLGSQDVSETSPDHAVTIEPLLTERVEVLRGPSTLLYGSSAIGGVINVIDRGIQREQPESTLSGGIEARYDTVSEGETYLGHATISEGSWALTFQGLSRDADDYEIPSEAEIHDDHEEEHHDDHDDHDEEEDHHDEEEHHDDEEEHTSGILESSYVENDYYSVGGTWYFNDKNYIGAAISSYNANYGLPGHDHGHDHHDDEEGHDEDHDEEHHDEDEDHEGHDEDEDHHDGEEHHEDEGVVIDLERTRFDAEIALFDPIAWIEAIRIRFGYTDYEHVEEEADEVAVTFLREGWELRAEAAHYDWGLFNEGIIGVQFQESDFEATGEEIQSEEGFAFGPPSTTKSQAVFISEHIHGDRWHYDFGARIERQTIDTAISNYSEIATSLSVGVIHTIDEANSLSLSLQRTERHPNATELFANGPHFATSQFEIGDPTLEQETAYGVDLGFRHSSEQWEAEFTVFYVDFQDYIFAENTGLEEDELPLYNYVATDATFQGLELEVNYLAYNSMDSSLKLGLVADYVEANNEKDDTNLPRIPPMRIGAKADFSYLKLNAGVLLRHSFDQDDTAPLETETDGYTELKVNVDYQIDLNSTSSLILFVRANNLLDEEIRHHTSFIKDVAPRPGRNFSLGARLEF